MYLKGTVFDSCVGNYSWKCVYVSAVPGSHELHGSPFLLQWAPWGSSPAWSLSKAVLGPWACAVSLPELAHECSWPHECLLHYECMWPCGFIFKALPSFYFKWGVSLSWGKTVHIHVQQNQNLLLVAELILNPSEKCKWHGAKLSPILRGGPPNDTSFSLAFWLRRWSQATGTSLRLCGA